VTVDPIAVSQEVLRSAVKRKRFDDLLPGPFRCRMGGDVEVRDASGVMREDNENEQNLEPDRGHREEID